MSPVQQILAVIRAVTAIGYFTGAMLLFLLALWLVWPVGGLWWPFDLLGACVLWGAVQLVRRGAEEWALNEAQRSQERRPE